MNNENLIKEVANDLKLVLDKNIIDGLIKSWSFFRISLEILNKFNTENIEPFYSPNFTLTNYLREDEYEKNNFDISVVMENSHHNKDNFILIKKVIK